MGNRSRLLTESLLGKSSTFRRNLTTEIKDRPRKSIGSSPRVLATTEIVAPELLAAILHRLSELFVTHTLFIG